MSGYASAPTYADRWIIEGDDAWYDPSRDATIKKALERSASEAARAGNKTKGPTTFLLYGPPGTGKTYLAKTFYETVKHRLGNVEYVYYSPSNFIVQGLEQIEKVIEERLETDFVTLSHLKDKSLVVVLDEMDELLMDRRRGEFRGILSLVTPAFLPRLQKLNNEGKKPPFRFVFVNTNFYSRIDPAMRRTGRIDVPLLVPPLSAVARRQLLIDGHDPNRRPDSKAAIPALGDIYAAVGDTDVAVGALWEATHFFTYQECKAAIELLASMSKADIGKIVREGGIELRALFPGPQLDFRDFIAESDAEPTEELVDLILECTLGDEDDTLLMGRVVADLYRFAQSQASGRATVQEIDVTHKAAAGPEGRILGSIKGESGRIGLGFFEDLLWKLRRRAKSQYGVTLRDDWQVPT